MQIGLQASDETLAKKTLIPALHTLKFDNFCAIF